MSPLSGLLGGMLRSWQRWIAWTALRSRGDKQMLAFAEVIGPDGERRILGHGDIIGRLWTAALVVDDPRVSEAHALISLRGAQLRLLALRGRFSAGGQSQTDVALHSGVRVLLAEGLELHFVQVCVPERVLALSAPGLPPQLLQGVTSVVAAPHPMLVAGLRPDALLWLWSDGRGWMMRGPDRPQQPVGEGDIVSVAGTSFHFVSVPVQPQAGVTLLDAHGHVPLRIVVRFDTVHIHAPGRDCATLEGVSARLVTELALMKGPVPWRVLAGELWSGDTDPLQQRQRLDVTLTRLRARLRSCGVRTDLVRSTGTGHLELLLNTHDTVEDAA